MNRVLILAALIGCGGSEGEGGNESGTEYEWLCGWTALAGDGTMTASGAYTSDPVCLYDDHLEDGSLEQMCVYYVGEALTKNGIAADAVFNLELICVCEYEVGSECETLASAEPGTEAVTFDCLADCAS